MNKRDLSPGATSTPKNKIVTIKSRPSIKDKVYVESPIPNPNLEKLQDSDEEVLSDGDSITTDNEDEQFYEHDLKFEMIPESARPFQDELEEYDLHPRISRKNSHSNETASKKYVEVEEERESSSFRQTQVSSNVPFFAGVLIFLGIIAVAWSAFYSSTEVNVKTNSVNQLKAKFKSQQEDFWVFVESGVQDVKYMNRPSTFLFLYKREDEKTMNKLLDSIASYAAYQLKSRPLKPILIKGSSLNAPEVVKDYGTVVKKYYEPLKKQGVMIVKNLEEVPGKSAQAFHSFCDEYNPLVTEAVFLITMQVDDIPVDHVKFTEETLRKLWGDLNDDIFYPLFTRISSIVLPVQKEK